MQPRLILVSKLKPPSDILSLHSHDVDTYAHFGENYVQELQAKSKELPKTIKWHFIGGLQSNKCKGLASDTNGLWCVSSVDSVKKADGLEKGRQARGHVNGKDGKNELENVTISSEHEDAKLRVHVQVNTSGEESKSGVEPSETAALCRHIVDNCSHLQLVGLMTIGAIARSKEATPGTENRDFVALREVRDKAAAGLGWEAEQLELSMGMSDDFESAIRCGANEVRVGSTIFGERAAQGSRVPEGVSDGGNK